MRPRLQPRLRSGRPALLLALALLAGCAPERAPRVGVAAPSYRGHDLEGQPVDLAALRGAVVVVNVWATWCQPCRRELPALQELQDQHARDGLRVIAVSIDAAGGAPEIRAFLDEHGIDLTVVHDSRQRVTRAFGTTGVPETFLIGRDGLLRHHWLGRIDARSPSVRAPVYAALDER